jgi:hypothetical protein
MLSSHCLHQLLKWMLPENGSDVAVKRHQALILFNHYRVVGQGMYWSSGACETSHASGLPACPWNALMFLHSTPAVAPAVAQFCNLMPIPAHDVSKTQRASSGETDTKPGHLMGDTPLLSCRFYTHHRSLSYLGRMMTCCTCTR